MSIWAVAYSRTADADLFRGVVGEMRSHLSRHPGDRPNTLEGPGAIAVWVDVGAMEGSPARQHADGSFSLIAGNPLHPAAPSLAREAQVRWLAEQWACSDYDAVRNSNGTFCAAHFHATRRELRLYTDRLGVRPIYLATTPQVVIATTALRILEALPTLERVLDVRGLLEQGAYGHSLADRTAFANIRMLYGGEECRISGSEVIRRRYWRLRPSSGFEGPRAEGDRMVAAAFSTAVGDRVDGARQGIAFLSGGLDSRVIVAELRHRGVDLCTFGFGSPRSKDQFLGRAFAHTVGTTHLEAPLPAENPNWSQLLVDAMVSHPDTERLTSLQRRLAWSGDGGSVGLGHQYLTERTIGLIERGDVSGAVRQINTDLGAALPRRILKHRILREFVNVLDEGVANELGAIDCAEPSRAAYVFLMENDQRRHLSRHFEEIDLHRLELLLPFFDPRVIEAVAALPMRTSILHRLYNRILAYLPSTITSVPWQAYPGHEPCPVPLAAGLLDQWSKTQQDVRRMAARSRILQTGSLLTFSSRLPTLLVRRTALAAVTALHALGIADYGYAVESAALYARIAARASTGR
jgi:asparagine synthase (glutamine-hydrolysing)